MHYIGSYGHAYANVRNSEFPPMGSSRWDPRTHRTRAHHFCDDAFWVKQLRLIVDQSLTEIIECPTAPNPNKPNPLKMNCENSWLIREKQPNQSNHQNKAEISLKQTCSARNGVSTLKKNLGDFSINLYDPKDYRMIFRFQKRKANALKYTNQPI